MLTRTARPRAPAGRAAGPGGAAGSRPFGVINEASKDLRLPTWQVAGEAPLVQSWPGPRPEAAQTACGHTPHSSHPEEASPEGQRPAWSQSSAAREAVKGRHTPWAKGRWGAREVGVVSPQVHLRSPLKCEWTAFAGLCDLRAPFKEKNTKLLNQK